MAEANDYMLKADRDEKAAKFETQRQAWEKTRERGRAAFYLTSALLAGGFIFVFRVLFSDNAPLGKKLSEALAPALWGCFAGLISALSDWHSKEKRYSRGMNQQSSTNESNQDKSGPLQRGTLNGNIY
jgi:hypothetical protein